MCVKFPILESLSQVLSGAVVGATVADEGEQELEQTPAAGAVGGDDNLYHVVGTLKDARSPKPSWVDDVIVVCVLTSQIFVDINFLTVSVEHRC